MKKIIQNIAFVILCFLTSCDGYLDPIIYNRFSNANFPRTEEDYAALVTGIYAEFRVDNAWYRYSASPESRMILGEIGTEEMWINWEWCNNPHIRFDFNPGYGLFNQFYDFMVPSVAKATFALALLGECTTLPAELKSRFEAEVKCCRAFWLYDLQGFYGSPVVVLDPEKAMNPSSDYYPPRLSDEELFEFIEKDLLSAIDILPERYDNDADYGRFTKGAASSLLMKLYMRHKKFDKAVAISEEIMKMGYDLEPVYSKIWDVANEKNSEIVFSLQNDNLNSPNSNIMRAHVLPSDWVSPTDSPIAAFSGYRVPWDVYDQFDPEDKRLSTLVKDYLIWENGQKKMIDGRATGRLNGALPLKYGEDPSSDGTFCGNDFVLIRYADILLLRAEALNELNGPTQESIDLINRIRIRAFGDDKPDKLIKLDQFDSKESLKDYILQERLFEFIFEGERREDLIRHGKYIEYAHKRGIMSAQPYHVKFPLPSHLIVEGKGNIKQNEGY